MRAVVVAVAMTLVLGLSLTPGDAHVYLTPHHHALDMQHGGPVLRPGVTAPSDRVAPRKESGGPGMVHRDGVEVGGQPAAGRMYRNGYSAGEPTLGITKDGSILYQGLDGGPIVLRTDDGGRKWKDVSPAVNGRKRHPESLDPFLYVDQATDRVFTYDFLFGCSEISFSDDEGETWTTTTLNCGLQDHQNLFAGPPVTSPTVGYANVVYTCSTQGGATIYSLAAQCLKSLDGGLTWAPTGEPAFVTDMQEENDLGVQGYCHGAIAHGYVGPDGTVYIPKGLCGQPWLAISRDEGLTWERVQISDRGMPQTAIGVYEHEASVAADAKGNVYYFWIANDRLPYLAVSRDEGRTWGKPVMVGAPNLVEAALPHMTLGDTGKLAIVYYGSTNSPGEPFPEADDCKPNMVDCFRELFFLNPPDPERYADVTWNGYMTVTADALDKHPKFFTSTVNATSDPLVRGTCGPIRCKAVYDFIDVSIDRRGRPWAAYVDACISTCIEKGPDNQGNEGVVGTIVGGPKLR